MNQKHIVIVGGGFGGMSVYQALHRHIHDRTDTRVTLIDRNNYFLFSPMLHEVATGAVERSHIVQPLREVTQCCLERFLQADVEHIDFEKRQIRMQNSTTRELVYDYLVFAPGTAVHYFGVPGAAKYCFPLKSMPDAVRLRNHVIEMFEAATKERDLKKRRALLHFVVIGGGPTGVELAGELADLVFVEFRALYQEIDYQEVRISLVHRSDRLLQVFRASTSKRAHARLKQLGVQVYLQCGAKEVTEDTVICDNGQEFPTRTAIWTSGVRSVAASLIDSRHLNKNDQVVVTPELHVPDRRTVYVVGDAAALDGEHAPFAPQTAQSAVAAAHLVAHNIGVQLTRKNARLRTFRFRQRGYIMPIGSWYAVAEIGPFAFGGRFAWWLRRSVFVMNLTSWMNRVRVVLDWTLGIFLPRDTSQL